jgi:hypothetical protein
VFLQTNMSGPRTVLPTWGYSTQLRMDSLPSSNALGVWHLCNSSIHRAKSQRAPMRAMREE